MRSMRTTVVTTLAILLLALPATAQDEQSSVDGRVLLPEGATLDGAVAWSVQIQDTSLADAPAVSIGAAAGAIEDPSATEIPFSAIYDPASVTEASTYTLSAMIVDEAGDLLFTNDTATPVITNGAPVEGVDVPLVAVASAGASEARVIEIEADAALRFLQDGEQIVDIPVTPGETVVFRIDNTSDFAHNFWIGTDEELAVPNGTTEVGIPDWDSGVEELTWVVPDDLTGLRFACTVPGHYVLMQGDFSITP